jgi:DMSO/TMAO reductase YedYZ molybdopterin-dependent catalytic subunit
MKANMKHSLYFVLLLGLVLSACAPKAASPAEGEPVLVVSGGDTSVAYTAADLQALGAVQATFNDVTYLGVPISVLLQDAGFDPQALRAVKVVALDGYTVNYEPDFFLLPDTLVSYARLDAPLDEDELPFRMVLPAAEGKMNVRQLTGIQAIP